jgi:hypothetical protein
LKREEKNEVVMLNRRSVILLARANLAFAVLASLAPLAHLLELPNKLTLNGPIWLAVQQHLYRGWGPFLGGPAEIGALITTLGLLAIHWHDRRIRRFLLVAAIVYAGMIDCFLRFQQPCQSSCEHLDCDDVARQLESLSPALGDWTCNCCRACHYRPYRCRSITYLRSPQLN